MLILFPSLVVLRRDAVSDDRCDKSRPREPTSQSHDAAYTPHSPLTFRLASHRRYIGGASAERRGRILLQAACVGTLLCFLFSQFITLVLAALGLTMTSAHVLEMPQRWRYSAELYSAVNTTLYRYFAIVGGVYQVGGIVSAWILTALLKPRLSELQMGVHRCSASAAVVHQLARSGRACEPADRVGSGSGA